MRATDRGAAGGDELQFIVFQVGSREFAVGILQVERILLYQTPAAGPAGLSEGVLAYGGRMIPVVDLRRRLQTPAENREETRFMVMDLEGVRAAVIVDRVSEVLRVDSRIIAPPPQDDPLPFGAGTIHQGERRITVCHAGRILSREERAALTRVPV